MTSAVPSLTTPTATTSQVSGSASTSGSSSSSAASQTSVDYNSFLQLMIQEMKNQDPTNPQDPTQYMSQIAMFSNVQQAVQTNSKLDSLLTTSSLTQAEGVIGKTVTSADGSTSGKVVSVALGTGGTATATLANGSTMTLDSTVQVSGS